jgi:hypothetical protein
MPDQARTRSSEIVLHRAVNATGDALATLGFGFPFLVREKARDLEAEGEGADAAQGVSSRHVGLFADEVDEAVGGGERMDDWVAGMDLESPDVDAPRRGSA